MPWNWLVGVMDSTEAQLRFGTALVSSTDSTNPNHPMNPSYGRQSDQSGVSSRSAAASRTAQAWAQRRHRLPVIGMSIHGSVTFSSMCCSLFVLFSNKRVHCSLAIAFD